MSNFYLFLISKFAKASVQRFISSLKLFSVGSVVLLYASSKHSLHADALILTAKVAFYKHLHTKNILGN